MFIAFTHLGITWANGIVWLTLTIFFPAVAIVKRRSNQYLLWNQIAIVRVLKIPDSFQACSPRIACVYVSASSWAVGDNISLDFKLEFITFAKSGAFLQTSHKQEECGMSLLQATSSYILWKFYIWQNERSCSKASVNEGKFSLMIIFDPLIISKMSWSFRSRYCFCLYSLLPPSIPTQTISLLPGVVYVMPDLFKKLSIHSYFYSFDSFFLLPDLSCTAIRRLKLLARVPVTSVFSIGQY